MSIAPPTETLTRNPRECSIKIWVGAQHCFLVSKFVLAEVPWLNNFFSEHQELSTYFLLDHNGSTTLRTLFLILHHRMHCLPVFLFEDELLQLAAVCQEYDVSHLVVPHVEARKWVEPHWQDGKPCNMEWIQWLKILRGLYSMEKHCPRLEIVLDVIAANMHLEEGRWIYKSDNIRHYYIADIDVEPTSTKLESCLETRRGDLWIRLRRACACLQGDCLKGSDFQEFLQVLEEVPPHETIVTEMRNLRSKGGGNEVQGLLEKQLHYLTATD